MVWAGFSAQQGLRSGKGASEPTWTYLRRVGKTFPPLLRHPLARALHLPNGQYLNGSQ